MHVEGRSHSEAVNARVAEIKAAGAKPSVEIVQRFATEVEAIDHEANLICAAGGLLNILARGWALTPEEEQRRKMAERDREWLRLGRKHREDWRRRVAHFSKFDRFGLPGLADDRATQIIKAAVEAARWAVADWDARLGVEVNAT